MKKHVLFLSGLLSIIPLSGLAFNLGDKIHYTIFVTNNSSNTVIANGQSITPNQTNAIVGQFDDVLNQQNSTFSHGVKITSLDNAEICTVTGILDIGIPGSFSMHADNSNSSKCKKSNGMNGMDDLYIAVTVIE